MRSRTELIVLVVMGLLLIVASIVTAQGQRNQEAEGRWGSSYSAGERGTRALFLWMESLGFQTRRLQRSSFDLQSGDGVLWIIAPGWERPVSETDAAEMVSWLQEGGTLVWVDFRAPTRLLNALELEPVSQAGTVLSAAAPWVADPGSRYTGSLFLFDPLPPSAVPLLVDEEGRAGAIYLPVGEGELWLFSTLDAFTNQGLFEEENSELVERLLSRLPADRPMTFDEIHHGYGGQGSDRSLLREMRSSPWGWGIFYAAGVGAAWLLLRGRRFGRAMPLSGEHLRREAGEYARSMAWLYRRARQRAPVLLHHRERLKRRLSQRYRLPPLDNDQAFVSALARHRDGVDEVALLAHLQALQQRNVSEGKMLALARANDEWLERLLG